MRNAIDRFCRRHPGFGIPKLMLIIVIISAFVYLFMYTPATGSYFLFHPGLIMRGQIWRLVTWVFMPAGAGNIFFTAIALYFYYFIGSTLEREWGTGKFTVYYLFGVLTHIVYGFIVYYLFGGFVYLQPIYLNLSMFFAFAVLFPEFTVRLFFIIPIKIKWLAIVNAAFFALNFILSLISGDFITAFMPVVALFGFFLICGDDLMAAIAPFLRRTRYNTSQPVMNFKREAKRVKRETANKPYRHRCAVCGITDTDNPQMEFRYCSQCNGYHCFCSEHINNHVHFRQ